MELKKIQDVDLKGKRVLLRVDFNVAVENGDIKEKFKIEAVEETIEYLFNNGVEKVAMLSWLGRPKGEYNEDFSLKEIVDDAERVLGKAIKFSNDCVDDVVKYELNSLNDGEILLLENVRFHKGENENDEEFSKELAKNFDIFIQDAFSVCHRDVASVTGVAKILPSFAGLRLQKEVENLEKIKDNPEHPAVSIIGGAKIETKLPLIKSFENNYDTILVGGRVANEAIDQEMKFGEKVILPIDVVGGGLDIGEETIVKFKESILGAKTIVWNGPMGKFEEKPYDNGTKEILDAVIESGAFSVMGGGESVQILEENNALDKISFVSTGGGAMLKFLSSEKMPGLEILEDAKK